MSGFVACALVVVCYNECVCVLMTPGATPLKQRHCTHVVGLELLGDILEGLMQVLTLAVQCFLRL